MNGAGLVLHFRGMKFSAHVANLDGVARDGDRAPFGPGSIQPKDGVPVRIDFDGRPIGTATIRVDGAKVFADFDCTEGERGLWPAVGGVVRRSVAGVIVDFDVFEVSLCYSPNVDPTIPPIR